MTITEAIETRRSLKCYDPNHRMTEAEVARLIQLAKLAPSSFNMQNYRFVLVRDPELRKQIRAVAWNQTQVTDASLLVILCADLNAHLKDPSRYWSHAPQEVQDILVPALAPFYEGKPQLIRDEAMRSTAFAGMTLMLAARENKNGTVYGPIIPSIGAQAFAGGLGGGRNGDTGNFGDQEAYFVGVGWRIGPGGLFDFSRQRAAKARLNATRLGVEKIHDEIVRQVVEAFTRMQSQAEQINMARRGLTAAEEGLLLAQQRQEFGVGIVLENIQAEQDLTRARTDYLNAIAEFNKAQYGLSKAVGSKSLSP